MDIRKAISKDLDEIMDIYAHARKLMVDNDNPTQWAEGHPSREMIEQDISKGVCYVCEDIHGIQGVFAFILGKDATYNVIEDGSWLNEEPYGTVHRLASSGHVKGIAAMCFQFCLRECGNVRVDTHEKNKIMQHQIEKAGFVRCGRIYAEDGTPRIAYQKVNK